MSQLMIAQISIRQDADGRFCLNDLHKAAGSEARHAPAKFMRNKQAKGLVLELKEGVDKLVHAPIVTVNDGLNNGTYACKELVYAYAMWISPAFNLKVIRTFDALQSINTTAWQELQAVIAKEAESKVRAQFGSYLMIQRKREIHHLKARIEALENEVQPWLIPLH